MWGKKPSMLEKLCGVWEGRILVCLEAEVAKARAIIKPEIVITSAVNFRGRGIVIVGVFSGRKFEVRIRPAIILPQARRPIDAITVG